MYAFFKEHFEKTLKTHPQKPEFDHRELGQFQETNTEQIKVLLTENEFLKQKIASFAAAFTQLNSHFGSGVSCSEFVLQKSREVIRIVKEDISSLKSKVDQISAVEILQGEVRSLNVRLEIERHLAKKAKFNSDLKV